MLRKLPAASERPGYAFHELALCLVAKAAAGRFQLDPLPKAVRKWQVPGFSLDRCDT